MSRWNRGFSCPQAWAVRLSVREAGGVLELFILWPKLRLACVFLLMLASSKAVALVFSVSGTIADDRLSVEVIVSVSDLGQEEFGSGDSDAQQQALQIRLPDAGSQSILRGQDDRSEDRNREFYWDLQEVTEGSSGDRHSLTYRIKVYNNTGVADAATIASLMEARGGSVRVLPVFVKPDGLEVVAGDSVSLSRNFASPAEAPSGIRVTPLHKGIKVSWTGNKAVLHTKASEEATGISRIPSEAVVMLFQPGESALDLKSWIVDDSAGNHQATTCRYLFSTAEEDCIRCPGKKDFIDASQEVGGLTIQTADNTGSTPSVSFNNLKSGEPYKIVVQYQRGVKRSLCLNAVPTETVTLAEANGDVEGALRDSRCFIATAAYGSDHHSLVHSFRWFRDTFLMGSELGRLLVTWYYEKSPPLAAKIEANSGLKLLARIFLFPLGVLIKAIRFIFDHKGIAISLVLLAGAILALRCFYFFQRRF